MSMRDARFPSPQMPRDEEPMTAPITFPPGMLYTRNAQGACGCTTPYGMHCPHECPCLEDTIQILRRYDATQLRPWHLVVMAGLVLGLVSGAACAGWALWHWLRP